MAGYKGSVGEVVNSMYYDDESYNNKFQLYSLKKLFAAPYHAYVMLNSHTEVGFSGQFKDSSINGQNSWFSSALVLNTGLPTGKKSQMPSVDDVLTYPCQGITNTATSLYTETPSPFPNRDLGLNPVGQSIYVYVNPLNTLTVKNATVTGPTGSVALLPFMTKQNDPNNKIWTNKVIITPDVPLKGNTDYSVVINGTNNGIDFTKSFTFKTGNEFGMD